MRLTCKYGIDTATVGGRAATSVDETRYRLRQISNVSHPGRYGATMSNIKCFRSSEDRRSPAMRCAPQRGSTTSTINNTTPHSTDQKSHVTSPLPRCVIC